MRLVVAAVGRLKDGAERELLDKYRDRFEGLRPSASDWPRSLWHELAESRAAQRRQAHAATRVPRCSISRATPSFIIALDERGKSLTSEAFARLLAKTRDDGAGLLAILVGGPDGLSDTVRDAAHVKLRSGAITLPHGLARIVLAEQLYRAATILAGHPYHRA